MAVARLVESGYRRYEGRRRGRWGAFASLMWASFQRSLGIRRRGRAKILPAIVGIIAFLPVIVAIAQAALTQGALVALRYPQTFEVTNLAVLLFAAMVAPEGICHDRRSSVLGLYLSSLLGRVSYVGSKLAAVVTALGVVTIGPPIVLLIGLTALDLGPDNAGDWLILLGRILGAGAVIAVFYASLSFAISSLTDRRAFASAGIVMLVLSTDIATDILVNALKAPSWLRVLGVFDVALEMAQRIFGEPGNHPELGVWLLIAGYVGWIALSWAVVSWRYRTLAVTR
jgi:ABC-2 type transport system permease protein